VESDDGAELGPVAVPLAATGESVATVENQHAV
jgi:hypothetical protein